MSADPLAVHVPGKADPNVYAYVSGAALKAIDPLGLDCGPDYCGPGAATAKSNTESPDESKSGYTPPPITPLVGGAKAEREVGVTAPGAKAPGAAQSWMDRPLPGGAHFAEAKTWGEAIKLGVETNPYGGGAADLWVAKGLQRIGQWLGKLRAGAAVADDLAYATAGGAGEANVARMVAKPPSAGPSAPPAAAAPAAKGAGALVFGKENVARFGSLNEARAAARAAAGLGDDAVSFVQKVGPFKGRVTGMQSPDGLRGWRVDFDKTKGYHVNWWDKTGGVKRAAWKYGANIIQGGTLDDFWNFMQHVP